MRTIFTLRFWSSIVALVVLTAVVWSCARLDDPSTETVRRESRRIDLVSLTSVIRSDSAWSVVDGRVRGNATAVLADGRIVQLTDGTLGESSCLFPDVLDACVLLADTLGDGVVWFSLVPAPPSGSNELELPAIESLLDGVTWARLSNGIEVPLLDRVRRECETETPNLAAFVQRFAGDHTTVVDLTLGEVSKVRCND